MVVKLFVRLKNLHAQKIPSGRYFLCHHIAIQNQYGMHPDAYYG